MTNYSLDVVTKTTITSPINVTAYNVTESVQRCSQNDCEIIDWLDSLLPPLLFTVGLISNTLVILVMRSKFFRSSSTSFYMIANAVTDFFSLLLALPSHYVYVNFPSCFEALHGHHWVCSVLNAIGWGTSDLGIYFTVSMTIERAIAVWKPLKSSKYCTKRRAKTIVLGLTLFEIVKICPFAIKSRVVGSNTKSQLCDIDRSNASFEYFYDSIWSWFHVAILIFCYVLAAGGNCAIVFFVKKSSKQRHLHTCSRRSEKLLESRKAAQNKQISVMLVVDSVSLIICTLPFAIVNLSSTSWQIFSNSGDGKNLAFTFSFYLLYINRCLNLFLYCVTGERFRRAMRTVVCRCASTKTPFWRQRVHGTPLHRTTSRFMIRDGLSEEYSESHLHVTPRNSEGCVSFNLTPRISNTCDTNVISPPKVKSQNQVTTTNMGSIAAAEISSWTDVTPESNGTPSSIKGTTSVEVESDPTEFASQTHETSLANSTPLVNLSALTETPSSPQKKYGSTKSSIELTHIKATVYSNGDNFSSPTKLTSSQTKVTQSHTKVISPHNKVTSSNIKVTPPHTKVTQSITKSVSSLKDTCASETSPLQVVESLLDSGIFMSPSIFSQCDVKVKVNGTIGGLQPAPQLDEDNNHITGSTTFHNEDCEVHDSLTVISDHGGSLYQRSYCETIESTREINKGEELALDTISNDKKDRFTLYYCDLFYV